LGKCERRQEKSPFYKQGDEGERDPEMTHRSVKEVTKKWKYWEIIDGLKSSQREMDYPLREKSQKEAHGQRKGDRIVIRKDFGTKKKMKPGDARKNAKTSGSEENVES